MVRLIYYSISKTLFCCCKSQEKPRVEPTGKAAINICGTTILSGLEIQSETKLLVLNDISKAALRSRLSKVKF